MVESFNVTLFGEERMIRVFLPSEYAASRKSYPVLYMHDGQNVFGNEEAIGGVGLELDKKLDDSKIGLIVVAIDQNPGERVNEYCPWKNGEVAAKLLGKPSSEGGKGKEYVEFIVNELKPIVDAKYRTDKNETFMAGISLGALITTYAACVYPEIFKRIAGLSSAFYRNQEEMERILKTADLSHLERVYFDCGTNEAGENTLLSEQFLQTNKSIFEIVKQKEIEADIKTIAGAEHNYKTFKKRMPYVISYLLS